LISFSFSFTILFFFDDATISSIIFITPLISSSMFSIIFAFAQFRLSLLSPRFFSDMIFLSPRFSRAV
jgi:hypothetical protein